MTTGLSSVLVTAVCQEVAQGSQAALERQSNLPRFSDFVLFGDLVPPNGVWSKPVDRHGIPQSEYPPKPPLKTPSASLPPLAKGGVWGGSYATTFDRTAPNMPPNVEEIITTRLALDEGLQLAEAKPLLERGKTLFAAERFVAAARAWQRASEIYEQEGASLGQAQALVYLSLAYQKLESWDRANLAVSQSIVLLKAQAEKAQAEAAQAETETNLDSEAAIFARALNAQGNIQLKLGQSAIALDTWERATRAYSRAGDEVGMLGSQINQAIALQTLGLYRRSQTILEQALSQLQSQSDASLKATGLRQVGVALRLTGSLAQSRDVLEETLIISQKLKDSAPRETSATLLSLGNTLRDLQEYELALRRYEEAAIAAKSATTKLKAKLNQIDLLIESKQLGKVRDLLHDIPSELRNLPPSRFAVYARVNFANSWMELDASNSEIERRAIPMPPTPGDLWGFGSRKASGKASKNAHVLDRAGRVRDIGQILASAIEQARMLEDTRAESHALGTLGKLYEHNEQWSDALELTRKALSIAEGMKVADLAARWEWQLGRLLAREGEIDEAIAAYSEAVESLQSLRTDLVAINPEVQFSFRETVEPVYRELARLLLSSPSQSNLQQVREVIEALRLAELDNFFREACLQAKRQLIDQIDPTAAVVYPIILPDRLAVILSRAGQPLFYYETKLDRAEIEKAIEEFRLYLNPAFFEEDRLRASQVLYDWLLRPAETELAKSGIETLVFVLDGSLRNLPIAALHDGDRYLVEQYSIALTPSLRLLEPQSLVRDKLSVLVAGLSEAREDFNALPGVEAEVNQIASLVKSEIILNRDFTETRLRDKTKSSPLPVVHIATHGQFSSKAEETFLVTWDGRINIKEFNELLRSREPNPSAPLELLVLSACQTAAGDKRAALGLAGFAVRSGARSTLATLWQVNDDSTAIAMAQFYQELIQKPNTSKAKALRAAQLALLDNSKFQHPFYWAPFVLVGNWL
ncbi:MAG: CHAT domain-containing protein [Oscillatoria sp. SIO1A7]|nr:CHAT domain-containing protein [Oscillatoria sp. SIO1A7]